MMKNSVFLNFSLMLTSAIAIVYGEARSYFNRPELYLKRIAQLREEVAREKFRHQLTTYEFHEFRQHVATLVPEAVQERGPGEKSYPLRSLASVLQKSRAEAVLTQRAKDLFEKGKAKFRDRKFEESNKLFAQLLRDHAYSAHVPEAMFLMVEGHYQLREYDETIAVVNKMVDLYPEFELTGYALLRAGKVYELQERHDDAISIYQTVLRTFKDRNLASVAQDALRGIKL